MKRFRCGDVVPGCDAEFTGHEDEILAAVGAHAHDVHGMTEVGPELVQAVRSHMVAS
jgi:predicted small metal-binding protein